MSERLDGFRADKRAVYRRAIDLGLEPKTGAIAKRCGLNQATVRRALDGYPVGTSTMLALMRGLDASLDDLFKPLDAE